MGGGKYFKKFIDKECHGEKFDGGRQAGKQAGSGYELAN